MMLISLGELAEPRCSAWKFVRMELVNRESGQILERRVPRAMPLDEDELLLLLKSMPIAWWRS